MQISTCSIGKNTDINNKKKGHTRHWVCGKIIKKLRFEEMVRYFQSHVDSYEFKLHLQNTDYEPDIVVKALMRFLISISIEV